MKSSGQVSRLSAKQSFTEWQDLLLKCNPRFVGWEAPLIVMRRSHGDVFHVEQQLNVSAKVESREHLAITRDHEVHTQSK